MNNAITKLNIGAITDVIRFKIPYEMTRGWDRYHPEYLELVKWCDENLAPGYYVGPAFQTWYINLNDRDDIALLTIKFGL